MEKLKLRGLNEYERQCSYDTACKDCVCVCVCVCVRVCVSVCECACVCNARILLAALFTKFLLPKFSSEQAVGVHVCVCVCARD